MAKKVIVAGHICLDITPVFPKRSVAGVADILRPGRLIEMGEADVHTGGAVANTGLAMKLLGADAALMGKVGRDEFGDMVLSILKKYDAADGMIVSDADSTSYSVVLAIPGIDRIFLHNPGANHTFFAKDIPESALKEADLFHFGYPPIMRSMYENDGEELLAVMKKAKACGCATSLDMAAVDADSEAGRADWKLIIKKVLPYVDFFVPSAEELCFMLDKERFSEWQLRANGQDITAVLNIEKDVAPLADMCMDCGAKVLVIKCGAAGMYYRTASADRLTQSSECFGPTNKTPGEKSDIASASWGGRLGLDTAAWSDKCGFEASYVPEKVLSGTGAGDTSIAAFLAAVLEGDSLENCMKLAAAEGASCVAAYDALSGLKSLDELREHISCGWKKNSSIPI